MLPPSPSSLPADAPALVEELSASRVLARAAWRDYLELTKPEISFLVAISALAGFILGAETFDVPLLMATLLGTALTSGGVGALNHYLERELDGRMRRTANRPLPTGRIPESRALAFGSLLVMAGVGLLCPLTNPLTGVLAALTVVLYLFVYTPLKRVSKYNTLVGTIPGALPALGGWTAATNSVDAGGWAVFLVLAFWQMPHFLALAWMYRKDYTRGEFAMLSVVEPDGGSTTAQALGFTLGLIVVSLLPFALGLSGWIYLIGCLALGADFLKPALSFRRTQSPQDARRLLMASVRYVPLYVLLLAIDRLL